jgi:hypothetical protein
MSTQSLAVIWPFRVTVGSAEYQHIASQIITDPPPCFTVGTRHSPNLNPADVGNNVRDNSPDHIMYFLSSDVQVLSHHLFHLVATFSVIRGSAIAPLKWTLDLWSSHRTVFVEKGSSRWILSSAVSLAAVVLWFCDTILFNVWRSLSYSFGFQPLILIWWCPPMICVCHHNLENCCSGHT